MAGSLMYSILILLGCSLNFSQKDWEPNVYGTGTWKFNTSLLKDPGYINKMKDILTECKMLMKRGYVGM
jgi:hypothetical protein